MVSRILCYCNSGRTYANCHGRTTQPRFTPEPEPVRALTPQERAAFKAYEERRIARSAHRYGQVRPIISVKWRGVRFVSVGKRILLNPKWGYFTDFLFSYIDMTLGRKWVENQIALPHDQRHPLAQWRWKATKFMQEHLQQAKDAGQDYWKGDPDGIVWAFLGFGYDLYTLENNGGLDGHLMDRLRHADQFQGALNEVRAGAVIIRAGCEIAYEDEQDGTRRHEEFVATHKTTGQKFSVEAKSAHRLGVLGYQSPDAPKRVRGFGKILRKALAKKPPHPLIVFLDTNLPPEQMDSFFTRPKYGKGGKSPMPRLAYILEQMKTENGGRGGINLLIATNYPCHWDDMDPISSTLAITEQQPVHKIDHPEALAAVYLSHKNHRHLPQWFPDEEPPRLYGSFFKIHYLVHSPDGVGWADAGHAFNAERPKVGDSMGERTSPITGAVWEGFVEEVVLEDGEFIVYLRLAEKAAVA